MSQYHEVPVTRRTFLQGAGAIGAGALLFASRAAADPSAATFPTRVLGKTNQRVTTLALGTWPCGRTSDLDTDGVVRLVDAAMDLGIDFIDAANAYGRAEEAIGIALQGRRDEIFLTSKVWANTAEEAEQSLTDSMRKLQTDHLDLVYVHSIGDRDVPQVMARDGSLDFLVRQKEKGVIRFIGISRKKKESFATSAFLAIPVRTRSCH
jgi:aryl-alcohol dehydrogenase-like predicted oxidoreductase